MRTNSHDLGLTVDLACPHTSDLFDVMSSNHFFNASYEWLMFEHTSLQHAKDQLCHRNLNVDSRVTLAVDNNQRERIPYLDYSVVVGTHVIMIVFRHPKRNAGQNAFLQPFDPNLWFTILATVAVSSVILGGAFRLESKLAKTSREYFLTIFGFICQQGYDGTTSMISTRLITFAMLLFSSLMYQFYSTFIIGSLLAPPPKYLKTARQLIDSNIQVTMENLFYNWDFYNRTKDPAAIEMFTRKIMRSTEKPTNITHGLELIRKGGYAIQCDTGYTYPIIKDTFTDDEICDLQEILISPHRPLHIPLEKGSPLKQYFRVTLRKLIESGSGGYYNREYFSQKPLCPNDALKTMQIDIQQVASSFAFLALAMVVSLMLVVLERIPFRFWSQKNLWEFVN
ncbi:ionotropic receptor 75a-like [Topomyia yanbarensis]|uniref:ionotropic receptor 75a-like n=1 Tax=Topomyia yanbarensis TaxID=2498891 RepID=UPI00273B5347|nr:ionotropic receptor 75a-like [Topomyia yanbarensis]